MDRSRPSAHVAAESLATTLAAALERAVAGRQELLREAAAAPDAPALREALRLSAAHIERLLAHLAAIVPPATDRGTRAA